MEQIYLCGHPVSLDERHFTCPHTIPDQTELAKLSRLSLLKSASFTDVELTDIGLGFVCQVPTLENLCVQGTRITNDGLKALQNLPALRHLRLKDNYQLNNDCVEHLLPLSNLVGLAIHETSIDQTGLSRFVSMPELRDICLSIDDEDNFTHAGLLEFSKKMPNCRILAKGDGEYLNGEFND